MIKIIQRPFLATAEVMFIRRKLPTSRCESFLTYGESSLPLRIFQHQQYNSFFCESFAELLKNFRLQRKPITQMEAHWGTEVISQHEIPETGLIAFDAVYMLLTDTWNLYSRSSCCTLLILPRFNVIYSWFGEREVSNFNTSDCIPSELKME